MLLVCLSKIIIRAPRASLFFFKKKASDTMGFWVLGLGSSRCWFVVFCGWVVGSGLLWVCGSVGLWVCGLSRGSKVQGSPPGKLLPVWPLVQQPGTWRLATGDGKKALSSVTAVITDRNQPCPLVTG